jgi:outer membrane protein TolC
VARTALFPSLTLGTSAGIQSSDFGRFAQASNLFWAVGPTLAVSLLDGGRRKAQIAGAEAALDEAGQRYRAVLTAFQQVEDQPRC